jgi:hypothetical protein
LTTFYILDLGLVSLHRNFSMARGAPMAKRFSVDEGSDSRVADDPFIAGQGKRYAFAGPKAGIALNVSVVFTIVVFVLATAALKRATSTTAIEEIAGVLPIFIFGVALAGLSALAEYIEELFFEAQGERPTRQSPLSADVADVLAFGLTVASMGCFAWGVWRLGWRLIPGGAALKIACAAC